MLTDYFDHARSDGGIGFDVLLPQYFEPVCTMNDECLVTRHCNDVHVEASLLYHSYPISSIVQFRRLY